MNATVKSKNNQKAWKKGKFQIFGNPGSRNQLGSGYEKNTKRVPQPRKVFKTKFCRRNLIKGINTRRNFLE